jgi:hypothetical protein
MRNAAILILLIVLVVLSGCAPRYAFEIRTVSIETNPPGVRVYQVNSAFDNETFLGTTPIRNQPVSILVRVKGKVNPTEMDWMASQINMLQIRMDKSGYETYEGNLCTDPIITTAHRISLEPN